MVPRLIVWIFCLLVTCLPVTALAQDGSGGADWETVKPLVIVGLGIVVVLGLMIGLKINAFIALIVAALMVSVIVRGFSDAMGPVASAFGGTAAGIAIVIAMAAVIGKCMLESGAADRIVNSSLRVTGEKQAATGLMGSGFVLAVPVFFDTVFYLLVPLARTLYRKTGGHYVKYIMAVSAGGAITHTLVPPTPGPLLVGANLGIEVGMVMLVGLMVGIPSAIVGLLFAGAVDRRMPIPMRPMAGEQGENAPPPLAESQLPPLWLSMLPVVLPVLMITAGTIATTLADAEDRARLTVEDIADYGRLREVFAAGEAASDPTPAGQILEREKLSPDAVALLTGDEALSDEDRETIVAALNRSLHDKELYDEEAFLGVLLDPQAKSMLRGNLLRMKPVEVRRMNRLILESTYPGLIRPHEWDSPRRRLASSLGLVSDPSFALLVAAVVALITLAYVRRRSLRELAHDVEESLMSAGVIILITAAGGAFGAMLQDTGVSNSVQTLVDLEGAGGITLLLVAFGIASVLKIAQGSSTVAMIVGSAMVAAVVDMQSLQFHPAYLAAAIGSGSLLGSWMNDSGFWVYAKMSGLTESEALKSWTPLLAVLAVSGLITTILFSQVLPLK